MAQDDDVKSILAGMGGGQQQQKQPSGGAEAIHMVLEPSLLGKALHRMGGRWQHTPAYKAISDVIANPEELLPNVFGAGERFSTGESNYLYEHPSMAHRLAMELGMPGPFYAAAMLDPKAREAAGRGVQAVLHPNDPSIEAESERVTGANKLISTDPRFRGKLQNFAVRTLFQGLKDPLTFATAGTVGVGDAALREMEIAQRAALVSRNPVTRMSSRFLATNVPEKLAQAQAARDEAKVAGTYVNDKQAIRGTLDESRKTISAVNTARNKGLGDARRVSDTDEALIKKNRQALKQINESQYTIVHHPPAQLVPTAAQPRPFIEYNKNFKWPAEIEQRLDLARPTDYALPNEVGHRTDPESVLREQLAQSRELIRRRSVQDQLKKNLANVPDREIRALRASKDPAAKMPTRADILKNIADVSPTETGPSVLRTMSDLQVDAMLATGVPHMRNITVAGLMSMPPQDVAKAAYWAAFNRTPRALASRLEEGADSHFGLGATHFGALRKLTETPLNRLDQSLRAARLQRLDKEMPNAENFEKLDRVNQDIGEYGLKPTWSEHARAAGANFPQWHGYNVPLMFGRAALRYPGRLANIGRTEQNFNDQLFPDQPDMWHLGGPAGEGASALLDPARLATGKWPSFFAGPSTAGIIANLRPSFQYIPERLVNYGLGIVPGGQTYGELMQNQLPIPGPALAGANLAGFYASKATQSDKRRRAAPAAASTVADPWAGIH
jgi:hypothetical protein